VQSVPEDTVDMTVLAFSSTLRRIIGRAVVSVSPLSMGATEAHSGEFVVA